MKAPLLALAALTTLAAYAAPAAADEAAYQDCMSAAEISGAGRVCANNWVAREQAAMTLAWRRAREATPPSRRALLEDEQEAFTAFSRRACLVHRADEADAVEQSEGYARCMTGVLTARTEQLRAAYAAFGDA